MLAYEWLCTVWHVSFRNMRPQLMVLVERFLALLALKQAISVLLGLLAQGKQNALDSCPSHSHALA
jgi:hypothetical protein